LTYDPDQTLAIEVVGMSSKSGSSTIKVPMASLSRTMQFIHRQGGKVINVTRLSNGTPTPSPAVVATLPTPAPTVVPQETKPEEHRDEKSNQQKRGKNKKR
jgi:CpcD/allophycocyanin linker domain